MAYKIQPGCTIKDAEGIAKNNVLAFWQHTWWRILFVAPQETVLEKVTSRIPRNLLHQRDVRRHQVVVDTNTGDIVGYARWILPAEYASEWTEAQTTAVSDEDATRYQDEFKATALPFGEHQDEFDALDEPVHAKQEELAPKGPYLSTSTLSSAHKEPIECYLKMTD
jgi:hypothetical protein